MGARRGEDEGEDEERGTEVHGVCRVASVFVPLIRWQLIDLCDYSVGIMVLGLSRSPENCMLHQTENVRIWIVVTFGRAKILRVEFELLKKVMATGVGVASHSTGMHTK